MTGQGLTYNQYLIFSIAIGAANVLTKLAHPAVIWKTIIPLARISSKNIRLHKYVVKSIAMVLLGCRLTSQDLGWVDRLHRRKRHSKDDSEDEDEGDTSRA